MAGKGWIWWKPVLFIASAALLAALIIFGVDVPREILAVIFVIAFVAGSKVLRGL